MTVSPLLSFRRNVTFRPGSSLLWNLRTCNRSTSHGPRSCCAYRDSNSARRTLRRKNDDSSVCPVCTEGKASRSKRTVYALQSLHIHAFHQGRLSNSNAGHSSGICATPGCKNSCSKSSPSHAKGTALPYSHTDSRPKRPARSLQKTHTAFLRMQLLGRYSDGLPAGRSAFDSRLGQDFCLLLSLQAGSGAHPDYFTVGTEGGFCRVKGAEARSWPLGSI
jgi:hypothetical protein